MRRATAITAAAVLLTGCFLRPKPNPAWTPEQNRTAAAADVLADLQEVHERTVERLSSLADAGEVPARLIEPTADLIDASNDALGRLKTAWEHYREGRSTTEILDFAVREATDALAALLEQSLGLGAAERITIRAVEAAYLEYARGRRR